MIDFNLSVLRKHYQWIAVESILERLKSCGHVAYLAGGCVRDALLGRRPNDLDVVTSATPDEVENLFLRTVSVGKQFGVIRVLTEGCDIEVASFRKDGLYVDGRRPESVELATPQEDANRRDFTVNALFYDLEQNKIIDFVGGEEDVRLQVIKTVGDPVQRFEEDKLRILRAVRFVAQLGFNVEDLTYKAICDCAHKIKQVSGERIRDELAKLLKASQREAGLTVLKSTGLEQIIFQGLQRTHWIDIPCSQDWERFALYFSESSKDAVSRWCEVYRFSGADKKNILQFLDIYSGVNSFLEMSLGAQLVKYSQPPARLALQLWCFRNGIDGKIVRLHQAWLSFGKKLPFPLLRGDDLEVFFKGVHLGKALTKGYEMQLEDESLTKERLIEKILNEIKFT